MRDQNRKMKVSDDSKWEELPEGGHIIDPGNAYDFNTGDWRTMRPVWLVDKCTQCLLCWPVCPEIAIPVDDGKRKDFDFDHCKGCGICVAVCPFDAIDLIQEG